MSAAAFRRRVDQQLVYCRQLLQMVASDEKTSALKNALAWQLEHTLCCYLAELARIAGIKSWSQIWTLAEDLRNEALRGSESVDIRELLALSADPDSWLGQLLNILRRLRAVEEGSSLRGSLFQSDLGMAEGRGDSDPTQASAGENLIASTRTAYAGVQTTLDSAISDMIRELEALIQRQRLGHDEY